MSNPFFHKCIANARRIGAAVAVFGVATAAVLYALGYYDLAFLDRESIMGTADIPDETTSRVETSTNHTVPEADTLPGADNSAPDTSSAVETSVDTNTPAVSLPQPGSVTDSVISVTNTALLSDTRANLPAAGTLADQGYTLTTEDYDAETMRIGRMQFAYRLPESFSLNTRTVQEAVYTKPANNSETTVSYTSVTADRPALELYMGAIFFDRGDKLFYIDTGGVARFTFDDTQTIPAYTRDLDGNPLYYRLEWSAESESYEKVYYRVEGNDFVAATYNDKTDGRGLYFDYPASYGLPDAGYTLILEDEEDAQTRMTEAAEAFAVSDRERLEAIAALPEEEQQQATTLYENELKLAALDSPEYDGTLLAYEKNGENLTGYKYLTGSQFHNGFAAVTANENRRNLFFIDGYGRMVLGATKQYYMASYERYVISCYRAPLTTGVESVGSYYFDHGWVRVRKQLIDYYGYQVYHNVRVIMDENVLVNRSGAEFPIPSGYELLAYSDGMLLLEKDGRYGFMDYTGNWIAEPVYADATAFRSGLATLTLSDGRVGMIDTKGNIVLPFAYSYISQASDGLIAAFDDAWHVYKIMER